VRNDQPPASFQVVFAFDPAAVRWEIVQARGIVAPQHNVMATELHITWDFDTCARANDWIPQQGGGACQVGRGWILTPHNGMVDLHSPALELPGGWIEVLVDMESDEPISAEATVQLWWSTATSGWASDQTVELSMLAGHHSYVMFLPPDAKRKPIDHVRLVARGLASDTLLKRIVIRPIP